LATPNYGFEKRQKELAKKRKKEDKLKAKAERKTGSPSDDSFDVEDAGLAPAADPAAAAPDAPAT
jgi:hypothetical protein